MTNKDFYIKLEEIISDNNPNLLMQDDHKISSILLFKDFLRQFEDLKQIEMNNIEQENKENERKLLLKKKEQERKLQLEQEVRDKKLLR